MTAESVPLYAGAMFGFTAGTTAAVSMGTKRQQDIQKARIQQFWNRGEQNCA